MPADYNWIKQIQKGDVLRAPSGKLRIVRRVTHYGQSLSRTSIVFLISRPSWTGRCYTVIRGNDLKNKGYQPTKAKAKLGKDFDNIVEYELDRSAHQPKKLGARDVMGIP